MCDVTQLLDIMEAHCYMVYTVGLINFQAQTSQEIIIDRYRIFDCKGLYQLYLFLCTVEALVAKMSCNNKQLFPTMFKLEIFQPFVNALLIIPALASMYLYILCL